jgi:LmbE family N-acetylglucosaminyl deacetylase
MMFPRRAIQISLVLLATASIGARAETLSPMPALTRADRIAVIAPHPDDEALATGGLIQQAVAVGAAVRVIYLTNGDHNQIAFKLYSGSIFMRPKDYQRFGEKRLNEAVAATAALGLKYDQLTFLGYPDWGLQQIWRDYWDDSAPFRSDATRATAVPYKEDYAYQHPYRPESILADIKTILADFRPTKIFTAHPCDTNPDHRATCNFVRLALLELESTGLKPEQFFYVIHFGDWPKPYHYHPEVMLTVPHRLLDNGNWRTLPLTPGQTETKHRAIQQNASQLTTRQFYLVAFARANELFATLPNERVINLPANFVPDWKQAVRNHALTINPVPPSPKLRNNGAHHETTSISLDQTEFLRQGDDLIVSIDFQNRLGPRTNVHLFLFGYQRGADFAKLPKIHININPLGNIHVFDDDRRRITDHHVTKTATIADKLILRVPLALLGGNKLDHIFTATRANLGEISADDTAWQLYELEHGDTNG